MTMAKRILGGLLSVFLALGILVQGTGTAFADGAAKQAEAHVTSLSIETMSGETVTSMWYTDRFFLIMDWDASANGATLCQGDYFDITLPDNMVFPADSASIDFAIYAPDGTTVMGDAHVSVGAGNKGGTVRITFNDWVEGKENVKGNIRLSSEFDGTTIILDQENTYSVAVDGRVVSGNIQVTGPQPLDPEIVGKWSSTTASADEAAWWVRINHQKANLTGVVLSDSLSEGTGQETYLADSFELSRVEFNALGDTVLTVYEQIDLTDKLTLSADGKSFSIQLGDASGQQYYLTYRTTYTRGTTLRNQMTVHANELTETKSAIHVEADSAGTGTGNLVVPKDPSVPGTDGPKSPDPDPSPSLSVPSTDAPRTGDHSGNLWAYGGAACAAAGLAIALLVMKRKHLR